jgi:large subunit ribosomal protein L10
LSKTDGARCAGLISIIDKGNFSLGQVGAPIARLDLFNKRENGMLAMKRNEKSSLVSMLQENLSGADSLFVIENKGLSVKETEQLRKELRPVTRLFKVVKNRLFKLAVKDSDFVQVSDIMRRPTAVAIATDGIAVAKILAKFAEAHPNLVLVGGKTDAGLLDEKAIIELSKLPSLLEIRGTIARILIEPASRLARVSAEYGKKN